MAINNNAELVELVTNQAKELLKQIQKDAEETSALTEDDRKNCVAICKRVEDEHVRLKKEFLLTSLDLIDRALQTSDQQKLRQIHQAWSSALENVTRQCENLGGPLSEVLRILSRNDPSMERKYSSVITGSVISSILAGVTIGVIITHFHPGCLPLAGAESFVVVAIAPLVAIVCATVYIIQNVTSTNLHTVYQKPIEFIRGVLSKFFPRYMNSSISTWSGTDVVTLIKDSLHTLDMNEEIWQHHEVLEQMKESVEKQLQHLEEST